MPRLPRTAHLALALAALAACDGRTLAPAPVDATVDRGDASEISDTSEISEAFRDASVSTDADADADVCLEGVDVPGARCVLRVTGRAVDERGAGLSNAVITWCGAVCFGASADAQGNFTVDVRTALDTTGYSLLVHGRPDHASVHIPSPPPVDGVVRFDAPLAVPRYTDVGPVLPEGTAGGTFTAGDVQVTVASGTRLEFDVEDALLGELGQRLRSVRVTGALVPAALREAGVTVAWALAPFNLLADRPVAVQLPNATGLAAGSAVEFVVLGQEIVRQPTTAGRALVAATGRISADGMSATTASGSGISFLTWVGVRPAR